MAVEDEGFLGRWSRRKAEERKALVPQAPVKPEGAAAPVPRGEHPPPLAVPTPPPQQAGGIAPAAAESAAPNPADQPPAPTLEDVKLLTRESDFKPFVGRHVPADVRNAAVKKLFTDPHYNVMDGLDIYIDDYSQPSPLPASLMAKMVSAQFMKLVDDPADADAKQAPVAPPTVPPAATGLEPDAGGAVASGASTDNNDPPDPQSVPPTPDNRDPHDDHADLQLQPDHAPGPSGAGPGTR